MDSGNESDHDPIFTELLEAICDGSQSHPNTNIRETHYKKRDHVMQRQSERKGSLKPMQNMGKSLHKLFMTVVKYISQDLTPLVESGSEVSHLIP